MKKQTIAIISIALLAVLAGIALFLFINNRGPAELTSNEEISELFAEVQNNVVTYEGVVTAAFNSQGDDLVFEVDSRTRNAKGIRNGEDYIYIQGDELAYFYTEENGWLRTTEDFTPFDEVIALQFDDIVMEDYLGLEECGGRDGVCHVFKLYEEENDSTITIQIDARTNRVHTLNATGVPEGESNAVFTYEQNVSELEIPQEIIEEAEENELSL